VQAFAAVPALAVPAVRPDAWGRPVVLREARSPCQAVSPQEVQQLLQDGMYYLDGRCGRK